MHVQNVFTLLSSLSVPSSPLPGVDSAAYSRYVDAYKGCATDRAVCRRELLGAVEKLGMGTLQGMGGMVGASASGLEYLRSSVTDGVAEGRKVLDGEAFRRVSECVAAPADCAANGKNYVRNKFKREKKKMLRENWRNVATVESSGRDVVGSPSVVGTVCTVDSGTAAEVEAQRTLALRRTAENKVATALAEHRLVALADKSRTDVVERLAAARYEKRINEAKAASQKSFKLCDESMKSLGSSGSAGEFALKQEIKKARDSERTHKYVQRQADLLAKFATRETLALLATIPPPDFEDEFDAFGECPLGFSDDQREAYYADLNERNAELYDYGAAYGQDSI